MQTHNKCVGFTLLKLGRFQVECWIVPPHEFIEAHTHPEIDSLIVLVKGALHGTRNGRSKYLKLFRPYILQSSDLHSATCDWQGAIFLNFQWWKAKPTSAAVNFVPKSNN